LEGEGMGKGMGLMRGQAEDTCRVVGWGGGGEKDYDERL
jgi:hypothetical protein